MPKCKHPIYIDQSGGAVGCGSCTPCLIAIRRGKTARLLYQALVCPKMLFVSLTYKDQFLKYRGEYCDVETGEVFDAIPTLHRPDLQNFNKRLRRRLPGHQILCAYAGEYGDRHGRPHFHLILFNLELKHAPLIFESWVDPRTRELMCDPARLDIQVPRSELHVSQYVMKYIVKRMSRKGADKLHYRQPEFARLPNHCGLGFVEDMLYRKDALYRFIRDNDDVPREFLYAGKRWPVPREFRQALLKELPDGEEIKEKAFQKYQERMLPLRIAACEDAGVCPSIPFEKMTKEDRQRFRLSFAKLAAAENAPAVACIEARADFYHKKGKL